MTRKLYRSSHDKFLGGVCGGLGEYFEIDPTLVRLIVVLLTMATAGSVTLAYILAWIIIPTCPEGVPAPSEPIHYPSWSRYLPGLLLVVIGALMLMHEFWFWFSWGEMWPVVLILFGLFLVFRHTSRNRSTHEEHHINGADYHSRNGGETS
ncbi:MAG TPA: PspC domain-containing protein [candidate division Zixibacteria bacterium]|nr:PspC domain-containing protein [candidate division Zixibacteria bacterium]